MKKRRLKKRYIVLGLFIITIGVFLFRLVFVSDIPKTQPNVNEKALNTLEEKASYIVNRWEDSIKVESFRLVVPEARGVEGSNHIELYFQRLKTTSKIPLAPIFFLAGGPGSSASQVSTSEYSYVFEKLSKYADVILLDQRGTGRSLPNLSCRNSVDTPTDITENVQAQILDDLVEKCRECADELSDMGINLKAYNSTESANDIDAIRQALGYDKISLYGYSYGTELSQHYVKQYRPYVDHVILAASLGPDHGVKLPGDFQAQFEHMDSLIRLDPKMSKYIPDFMGLVKATHERLQKEPQFVQVPMQDAFDDEGFEHTMGEIVATFKSTWDMTMTDDHFQMMVSDKIGQRRWIQRMPKLYYDMSQGEYRFIGNQLRNFRRRRLPNALFFTVNAQSGYPESLWNASIAQSDSTVFSHFGISYGRYPEVYKAFGMQKIEGMNDAVYSDVPTLFISGSLDGRTPLKQADEMAKRFPNSKRIVIENAGHNDLMNNAVFDGIVRFLHDSLADNVYSNKPINFMTPVPYKYTMADTLANAIRYGNAEKAIAKYQQLYATYAEVDDYIYDLSEWPFYDLAETLFKHERYKEAVAVLHFAIKTFPEDEYLYLYLAMAYEHLGNTKNAERAARKALSINYFEGNSQVLLKRL